MSGPRRRRRLAAAVLLLASGGPGIGGCANSFSSDCAEAGESCELRACCAGLQCARYMGGFLGAPIWVHQCSRPEVSGVLGT